MINALTGLELVTGGDCKAIGDKTLDVSDLIWHGSSFKRVNTTTNQCHELYHYYSTIKSKLKIK